MKSTLRYAGKTTTSITLTCLLVAALGVMPVSAAGQKKAAVPETPLTDAGQKLEAQYAATLKNLQAEIAKAVPVVDEQKKAAYLKTREAENAAETAVAKRQGALNACRGAAGSLEHRKNWVAKSTAAVAELGKKLKQASSDDARKAAQAALEKEQKNKALGEVELRKSQEAAEKAKIEEPQLAENFKVAQTTLAQAQADTLKAVNELGLNAFLSSDKMDAPLAKFVVLSHAPPCGLAEFAQQGAEQAALVDKLLADDVLMVQMVSADGAKDGKYGQAMQIYTGIQKASAKAKEGVLQRLALAVSLEQAVPIAQGNPKAQTDARATVDPVKRYQHFEKAYLDGELDPGFKDLIVWGYCSRRQGDERGQGVHAQIGPG